MAVPVGTFGEIMKGDELGRFVIVQDDRERSGGYVIITSASRALDGDVFDSWVLPADLAGWFEESGWDVAWDAEPTSRGRGSRG